MYVNKIRTKISSRIKILNAFLLLKGITMKINMNAINATESVVNQAETNVLYLVYTIRRLSHTTRIVLLKKKYIK